VTIKARQELQDLNQRTQTTLQNASDLSKKHPMKLNPLEIFQKVMELIRRKEPDVNKIIKLIPINISGS
jgi:hypothetical protein